MPTSELFELVKYGSNGLMAIVALWTVGLLYGELKHRKVRRSARRWIATFMTFITVMTVIAIGCTIYERDVLRGKEEKLAETRQRISRIDTSLSLRAVAEKGSNPELDDRTKEMLEAYLKGVCSDLKTIYSEADWGVPACVDRLAGN
jgi:hypothetical protein